MDDMLREALRLRHLGFAIHWLRPASKMPVLSDWAKAPLLSPAELIASYQRGYNVGFRPGKWSVVGDKEICVLDIDIRGGPAFADEAYAAARQLLEDANFDVISGSGVGRHRYLGFPVGQSPTKAATTLRHSDIWVDAASGAAAPPNSSNAKPAWVIEILSTGKNVVMPPSIHPDTQIAYQWSTP